MTRESQMLGWLIAIVVSIPPIAIAEDVTVTTYFPSPRGNYQTFATTGNTTLATDAAGSVGIGGLAQPGAKLEVIGNLRVRTTPAPTPGQVLTAADANGTVQWVNPSALVGTATGSGTVNTVPKWTGASSPTSALGNSIIVDDGTNVGIGDASPLALLTVGSGDLFRVASTGHVQGIAGTAAVPAYAFTGDSNTGIYSGGPDVLRFATGGLDRVTMDAVGNVGIGIVPAGMRLDVAGTVRADDFVCRFGDCLGVLDIGDGLGLSEIDETVFQQRVTGTCAPGSSIRVIAQNGTVTCELDDTSGAGGVGTLTAGAGTTLSGTGVVGSVWDPDLGDATITASGGAALPGGTSGQTLRHDGANWVANSNLVNNGTNVGIGTTVPAGKLTVSDGTDNVDLYFTFGTPRLRLRDSGQTDWEIDSSGGSLRVFQPGSVKMSLNAAGRMDVQSDLWVAGQQVCRAGAVIPGCGGGSGEGWTDAGTIVHLTTSSDNVGIGTTAPAAKLAVVGQATFGPTAFAPPGGEPLSTAGGGSGISFSDRDGVSPRWVIYPASNVLRFWQNGVDRMTLNSTSRLDIAGDAYVAGSRVCTAANGVCGGGGGSLTQLTLTTSGTSGAATLSPNPWTSGAATLNIPQYSGGGGSVGPGTPNRVSKFTAAGNNVQDSIITDNGSTVFFNYSGGWTEIGDIGVRVFNPESQTLEVRLGAPWNLPGVYSSGNLGLYSGSGQNILLDNATGRVQVSSDLYVAGQRVCRADGTGCPSSSGGGVTGSGSINVLPKWTNTANPGNIANSQVSDDGTWIRFGGTMQFGPGGGDAYLGGGGQDGNLYIRDVGGTTRIQFDTWNGGGDGYIMGQRICRQNGTGCPSPAWTTVFSGQHVGAGNQWVNCPGGYIATGGGIQMVNTPAFYDIRYSSYPDSSDPTMWRCELGGGAAGGIGWYCRARCLRFPN